MQQLILQFEKETRGLRGDLVSEMTNVLTGRAAPRVATPIIAQAQEQSRLAGAKALSGTESELAMKGLAGTPFGERIMAEQRQAGQAAVGGIAPQIQQQYIEMLMQATPGYATGQAQAVLGSTAGTRQTQAKAKSWQI
jgi:hypothetical protein